jgi:hypothetical protein
MTYLRRSRNPFAAPKRKKVSRVGKATGTVRLVGADRSALKDRVYLRCNGHCELRLVCNGEYVPYKNSHLAHVKSVGSGGPDTDANTRYTCPACHIQSHAYGPSNKKPVPPKCEK